MRVVADTNVVVSALLWTGPPHQILTSAEIRHISLYTSPVLIDELAGVLARPHLTSRMHALQVSIEELIVGYLKLAHVVTPEAVPHIVKEDPDDDHVLACAHAAQTHLLVTGDSHLLRLKSYHSIQIVTPRAFLSIAFR